MNIVDALKARRLERKLDNGLTEVKIVYSNGQLEYHYFEDENNDYHGEFKSWYSNGTLYKHCFYENGKAHGEYKSWWTNGTLEAHCFYKNNKLHGEYKEWWSNGTLREHYFYEYGKMVKDYYNAESVVLSEYAKVTSNCE